MKKFIETLQNIWKIKELRNKILFTLVLLAVYRLGAFIPIPGVDPAALEAAAQGRGGQDLLSLINTFAGGAFNRAAIFALGIMPYITASIIIQLLGFAVPYFQRLQQQEGESGRKKITQITRWLTLAITLVQGGTFLTYINSIPGAIYQGVSPTVFWFSGMIILSAGTIFAMWLGERITENGIGNGVSLLIMIGIIATLPAAFAGEVITQLNSNSLFIFIIEMVALFFIFMVSIMIVQGVRKIPLQFAKRMVGRGGSASIPMAGARDYIPLKVNAAGVMPIIFAQAIMFLPTTLVNMLSGPEGPSSNFFIQLSDWQSIPYNVIFFFLVVIFTYVYTALMVNPKQYAEYLKRQNAFIPGVKPGKNTEDFIDTLTTRVTLPGSIFLGLISILPAFAASAGVNQSFAYFFGGTSLLILVGVVLDTLQQIESHLLMRRYDGLVKSGKLKGRSGMQPIGAGM